MAVPAASISGDYQDISTALVLRRATCTERAVAEGRGGERYRELVSLCPVPFPQYNSLLGIGDLLFAACQPLRAISQCWKFPVPASHRAPGAEGGKDRGGEV